MALTSTHRHRHRHHCLLFVAACLQLASMGAWGAAVDVLRWWEAASSSSGVLSKLERNS